MALRPALLTATRKLIDEKDSTNSHWTNDEIYTEINAAIRQLGVDLEWPLQLRQATPVAEQAVYDLGDDFVSLNEAYYDNMPLIILDRADLPAIRSDWQNEQSGLPRYAYRQDNSRLGLYPKPSADNVANSEEIQIQIIKIPADLSDDVTAPDLNAAFHDCIPFYAAFILEHSLGNDKRAQLDFTLYESHKKRLTPKVQKFSDGIMRFRWSGRY